MADSFVQYTASGSTDTFNITFGYLDPTHVSVTVDGVTEAFTFPSASQVQITSGNPAASSIVEIRRTTPRDSREVVWSNASNLTATDLNTSDLQFLYITQESFDNAANALLKDSTGVFDAESLRIKNLATPTQDTDAATKAYADSVTSGVAADVAQVASDRAAVEALYDLFDDRYLGAKASDPSVDNDGNALAEGSFYYNTGTDTLRFYNGSSFENFTTATGALASLDTVGTTQIDDNAVTLGKMEHGTQGNILYYGASGVPTRLAPGTAGQVLQTGGAGANPSWADTASGGGVLNSGHATNKYYGLSGFTDVAGGTVFANNIYFHPVIVTEQTTFTRVGLNITSGAAGNGRFGIYSMTGGLPSALVADLGTISTSSTGQIELTISEQLDPGVYCIAFVCSNNFSATQADIIDSGVASIIWGISDIDVSVDTNKQAPISFTYGALPDPVTGTGSYTANNGLLMWLRKV